MNRLQTTICVLAIAAPLSANALTCPWWQFKRSETVVNKNPKPGAKLRQHPRRETCVDRWRNADLFINRFSDKQPEYWNNSIEVFKKWETSEKKIVLTSIDETPEYSEMENYYFHRASRSEFKNNPASIDRKTRSIAIFDTFFQADKKSKILVHESGHYLYFKLSAQDKDLFLSLSGWMPDKDNPESLAPPLNAIKDDSKESHDEDFGNHLEEFYESPEEYKKTRPLLYGFFYRRLKNETSSDYVTYSRMRIKIERPVS